MKLDRFRRKMQEGRALTYVILWMLGVPASILFLFFILGKFVFPKITATVEAREKARALLGGLAAAHGVELATRVDAAVPPAIWGDRLFLTSEEGNDLGDLLGL